MSIALVKSASQQPVLITGGAGFIGTNLAHQLLRAGRCVRIFDNFNRPGTAQNPHWLCGADGSRVEVRQGDVRSTASHRAALKDVGTVFHLAARVAVTTSLADPCEDFAVNTAGTFNLLEFIQETGRRIGLIFASKNKVYGALDDVSLAASPRRYRPVAEIQGIDETQAAQLPQSLGMLKRRGRSICLHYARGHSLDTTVFR